MGVMRLQGAALEGIVTEARACVVAAHGRIAQQIAGVPFVPNSGTHVVSASMSLAVAGGHLADARIVVPGMTSGFLVGARFPAHLNLQHLTHLPSGALRSAGAGARLVKQADDLLRKIPGSVHDTPSTDELVRVDQLLLRAIEKFDTSLRQAGRGYSAY